MFYKVALASFVIFSVISPGHFTGLTCQAEDKAAKNRGETEKRRDNFV
jgi:hypothetical protein